jgi:hypothetical protein
MRNGRSHHSKCRGKVQEMGVLYTYSPKRPSPFPKLPPKKILNLKKTKIGPQFDRVEASKRSLVSDRPWLFNWQSLASLGRVS